MMPRTPDTTLRERAAALGLFGLQIPTDHDGIGLSATDYARVMQEIAGRDGTTIRDLWGDDDPRADAIGARDLRVAPQIGDGP